MKNIGKAIASFYDAQIMQMATTDLVSGYSFEKPKKYFVDPLFVIKIPYLYLDQVYEDGDPSRKGLFFGWHEIEIGKRKVLNPDYKVQLQKYQERPKQTTIKFKRYAPMKPPKQAKSRK